MKAMKFLLSAAMAGGAVLTVSLAAPALAQERAPSHVYAGGTLGMARWHLCADPTNCDATSAMLGAFAGYQINSMFSVEGGFRTLGQSRGTGSTIKGKTWEAVGVAAWPVEEGLSVYGKLGLARSVVKADGALLPNKETTLGPTFGLGAQVDLTKSMAVRAEFQVYHGLGGTTLPKGDVDTVTLGILWRFH